MILEQVTKHYAESEEFSQLTKYTAEKGVHVEGISPASFSLILSAAYTKKKTQTIAVTQNYQAMQELALDLSCYVDPERIFTLPPYETLPYEFVSPSEKIERDRVTALYQLLAGEPILLVTTVESLVRTIPHSGFFTRRGIEIQLNEDYPFDDILEMLTAYGFTREYKVETYGQFSVKGGIIDVYLPTHENPVRLDFFGDTCESIRTFDPITQTSLQKLESITIYPRREIILSANERDAFEEIIEKNEKEGKTVPESVKNALHHEDILHHGIPGIEELFPLIMDTTMVSSLFHERASVFLCNPPELRARLQAVEKTFHELYTRKKKDTLCLPPEKLLVPDEYAKLEETANSLQVFTSSRDAFLWKLHGIPSFHGRINNTREELGQRIGQGWKIIVSTGFEGQARRLYDLFSEFDPGSNFTELDFSKPFNIVLSPLREGLEIENSRVMIITDHEIFGKTYRKKKKFKRKTSKPIESFLELKTGDHVVHINHGIGIFRGMERMTAGGLERDFLTIEYADGDRLYMSLDQIPMIQQYVGLDGKHPRLDALGKKSAWNRIKERVQQSVEEIAEDLIKIYSQRKALRGFQFPPDTTWQEEFEALFEYEETPDQITAIEDVKDDMERPQPMDRLVCGDVGFGKTEVAIRAAFKAVMAGKQVAILVPTTVLAMQHFSTFKKRFEEYPVKVEMISRFRTRGQINTIKENLLRGDVDICIGTHALLSKDVKFKNIGLLIVDEEQRFGVKHKEQLKKLRTLVDVLTLSATPIPRTLHMSLAGIRDLSIITTPPENRQSIETYVMEDNPDIVRMAIMNEVERGGQVFYVHNRVQSIEDQAMVLKKLVPEASFCVAHGQMHEHELEEVMIDFLNGKYDVLVSTSIIESGLDIPNVNTIVVNRADTFGLSQLYQLKGRVGRSARQAYAYLFYPRHIPLTEVAQKRLHVISEYADLGSGFKIAMKDLEIRGSGNILGREQSGNIMDVGFELYTQMLEDAVRRLKGEKPVHIFRTPVFLKMDLYIPELYIDDERQKIEFYKRFESCETVEEVEEVESDMIDRFGQAPGQVTLLVEMEKVRSIASSLQIDEILEDSRAIKIRISGQSQVDVNKLVSIIQKDKRLYVDKFDKELVLFNPGNVNNEKKLHELKKLLRQLQ